jgi:hypothetical protein
MRHVGFSFTPGAELPALFTVDCLSALLHGLDLASEVDMEKVAEMLQLAVSRAVSAQRSADARMAAGDEATAYAKIAAWVASAPPEMRAYGPALMNMVSILRFAADPAMCGRPDLLDMLDPSPLRRVPRPQAARGRIRR